MKLMYYFLFVILLSTAVLAQTYPEVSIRDIQFVHDTTLAAGNDTSPLVGDTVTVIGVVMIPSVVDPTFNRKPIMWAGSRWQTYLRDTSYSNNEWAGLNIIQNDTNAITTNMDLLDTAQIVKITGVVSEYVSGGPNGGTQLNVLTTESVQFLGSKPNRGEALELNLSDLHIGGVIDLINAEKYEEQYVMFRDVISSDRNTSTGVFWINDSLGNKMQIHDQSGYFTKRATHKLREFDPPLDGSRITYIKGVLGHFSNPNMFVIRPMTPDDLLVGKTPPAITSIRRNTDLIQSGQAVDISANIADIGGVVTEAKINYRINGGPLNEAAMTMGLGDVWTGTIPGVSQDSALVDFFLSAKDNDDMIGMNPVDTSKNKYFYFVLNRPLTVVDVQCSPFGGGYSAYNNYRVTVSGIVTADTSDLQGDGNQVGRRVYIQDGQGPWSGIWVWGSDADQLMRGQNVTVSGLIREDNSNTRIDSVTQIIVNSSGNPLPEAELISTRDIAAKLNGTVDAEKWEGVLVKYASVTITDDNSDGGSGPNGGGNYNYGEITIADTSNINTRVELQEGNHLFHNEWISGLEGIRLNQGDTFTELKGMLFYSFSNYKLVPRKGDDFQGHATDVNDQIVNPEEYQLQQNYPNPFNPSTVIEYSVPVSGYVTLNIYNVLGQLVQKLVNMEQNAGKYKVIFQAKNLPSGIYVYEIKTDNFRQSKKMMFIK